METCIPFVLLTRLYKKCEIFNNGGTILIVNETPKGLRKYDLEI